MTRAMPHRVDSESFDRLEEAWLGSLPSAGTRSAYRSDLSSFARWCARNTAFPLAASIEDISAYQRDCLMAGVNASTVRRRSSALASFFDFAVANDVRGTNPVVGSNRPLVVPGDPSSTPVLDAEFVERYLLGAARFDSRLHALVALLVFDGLKLGEALELDTDDISGRAPKVVVRVHRSGGTQSLVLDRRSSSAVRRCAGKRHGEPLFISGRPAARHESPRRLTRFGAHHLIGQVPGPDGAAPVTTNALRRFYMSSARDFGIDIDSIRDRAGLSDRRGAQRYLRPPGAGPHGRDAQFSQRDPADHGSDRRSTKNNKEV